jgi:hypothetical protein
MLAVDAAIDRPVRTARQSGRCPDASLQVHAGSRVDIPGSVDLNEALKQLISLVGECSVMPSSFTLGENFPLALAYYPEKTPGTP